MRVRVLLAITATLALAACGESASTAPQNLRPGARSADEELVCRSTYHVATRADGTQYCEADEGEQMMAGPVIPDAGQ
ncbi:MAG: hypothetical protein ABI969_00240 [bacterium]